MADEEDYLDLVIAGELVVQWLQVIQTSSRIERLKEAAEKLRQGIVRSEAYAEEAMEGEAPEILNQFLRRCQEEWKSVSDDIQVILNLLEKHVEKHGKVVALKYGNYEIRIRQGAIHDGLGARVWKAAHLFNELLASHAQLFRDKRVLEIGSGCGSSGILTAIMAPTSTVVLTDCMQSVLENLRACCRLNLPSADADRELECVIEQMNDGSIEALSCEETTDGTFDDLLPANSWDVANMNVRYLDWATSCAKNESIERDAVPPEVQPDDLFEVILGCEVLYEEEHASLVAHLVHQRLAAEGWCLIAGAVREQEVYDSFLATCGRLKLRVIQRRFSYIEEAGLRAVEYEGGVVLLQINHQTSQSMKSIDSLMADGLLSQKD